LSYRLLVLLLLLLVPSINGFAAGVEGRLVKSLQLSSPPLDVDVSPDGQQLFVLETGKLLVYTIRGDLLGEYRLEKPVSSIKAQSPNLVLLYDSAAKQVDYLLIEVLHDINTAGAPAKGPADAPVTIVMYDDFQCPYCAKLEPVLKQVEALYPNQVRFVFKNFPLRMHNNAKPAALAALAAERQGKFWEFHDQLFANYNRLSPGKIEEIAKSLQLDLERFKKDQADPALLKQIDSDSNEAQQLGARGTPTIFLNGRLMRERSLEGFRAAIDQLLQKQTQ